MLVQVEGSLIDDRVAQEREDAGAETAALKLINDLKAKGVLQAFGAGRQVKILTDIDVMR